MKTRWVMTLAVLVLAAGTAAHAANWVSGLVPDWNQPNWHGANGPNGGPAAPAWGAWCTPTSAANLAGHWEDHWTVPVADGVAFSGSGVAWPNWPVYQDYQANGQTPPSPQARGTLSPGAPDDLGWYMDTNGLGDPAHGNPPGAHKGTFLKDVSPGALGLNKFLLDVGQPTMSAYTHGPGYADPQTPAAAPMGFGELTLQVGVSRTALAHFSHWNILFLQFGPAAADPKTTESDWGFDYYTWGPFQGNSGSELDEEWNGQDGDTCLGHTVTVVGYIPADDQDDVLGGTNWVIVHDNWSTTPRNVAVPFQNWVANTVVVPEPGVLVLGIGGLTVLMARRRRG